MEVTSILFVNLSGLPYDEMAKRLSVTNTAAYRYASSGKVLPLSILYLSAYLKDKFRTSVKQFLADCAENLEILDNYDSVNDFILGVAKKSISNPPDIVAISLMFSTSYKFFKNLLNIYKTLWPKATFIVGGIHATNTAQYILETTDVDYVFRGEAELALAEFIRNYRDKQNQNIQGVYAKNAYYSDFNQICELATNLNNLPYLNWELVNLPLYAKASKVFKRYQDDNAMVAELVGSRGCPFKCIFCSGHSSNNRNVRFRSVENIMGEVKELHKRYGVTRFIFNDDLIVAKEERFFKIINVFKDSGIPGLQFQTQGLHCRFTTNKMIDAISKTTSTALFPVDSGSQYVQDHIMKKKVNLERVKELVAYSHEKGLIVRCNFIFGFPNETKEMMNESADYMRALNADWNVIFTAIPFVGTELHNQFVQKGILKKYDEELWELSHYGERSFDTDTCTAEELIDFTYRLNLEVNFINNYNLRTNNYKRALSTFKELVGFYPYHVFGLIALWQAYKGLNDMDNCAKVDERIHKVIAENEAGRRMYERYRGLLKDTAYYNLPL